MSISDIKKMPLLERVHLMEQIWDTLRDESEDLDSPAWHKDILKERKEAYNNGNVKSYTVEEIRQKLI
ncbi:MAG TPA: addiction module component CHP02574 family protein [Campylobacterales bacterium]|nr:addiction module component CHP02574 family protein [Campylobacterales bacterium]